MKHLPYLLIALALLVIGVETGHTQEEQMTSIKVPDGFVPTKEVAIEIAVAVWKPIYGEKEIRRQKPYQAELKDGIWHVRGHLPEGYKGGVALARISKETGSILFINHSK